jgi:hypothetical protein
MMLIDRMGSIANRIAETVHAGGVRVRPPRLPLSCTDSQLREGHNDIDGAMVSFRALLVSFIPQSRRGSDAGASTSCALKRAQASALGRMQIYSRHGILAS